MALTAKRLRDLLHYDPETGVFTWLVLRGKRTNPVGRVNRRRGNQVQIDLEGRTYAAHRLAWLYMTGEWPAHEVDHKNCVREDNRWSNLRAATTNQNHWNIRAHRDGASGFKGVTFCARDGVYFSRICVNRKSIHLGSFSTPEEAHAAYVAAAKRLHGEFARVA